MTPHTHSQAVQRETVCLPEPTGLKANSGLHVHDMVAQGRNAGLTHQTGQITKADQADKLAMIRTLSKGEVEGWRAEIMRQEGRPFDGEAAALAAREKQLKGAR